MGHVGKRIRNGKVIYRVRYRAPDGRERSKNFRRKADAEKYLATVENAKLVGTWTDPAHGKVTLSAWLEAWWATAADLRPSTRARDRSYFDSLILPRFGTTPLAAIRQRDVQAWGGRPVGEGLCPGDRGQGLSASGPHDDRGGERRHAGSLALPGCAAAEGRAGGDAVPDPGRGCPPGRCNRPALSGAGARRCLWRASHGGAGWAASASG